MRLVIDRGNSSTKGALYDGDECVERFSTQADLREVLNDLLVRYNVDSAIISSTATNDDSLALFLKDRIAKVIIFDAAIPTPLAILYRTPQTLGADRLASAVGAWERFKDRELIVFDFGSAITIDFVSAKGEFMGGNISPGLTMRFAALNHFTGRLPLVEINHDKTHNFLSDIGVDTLSAIEQGVVRGICYEIEGYLEKYSDKIAIFTGGDALFFEKQIKNTIFVHCDATLNGLRSILDYNA